MKKLLYFPLGVILVVYDCIRWITERGEIAVSNYEFWQKVEKNSRK